MLRCGASQESECITIQTDCYSFATLMWDCATRGYAWQGLGLLHVSSAALGVGATLVCLFVRGRPWTIPVQVMTKVVVENMRPPTQPVRQARPTRPNLRTNAHRRRHGRSQTLAGSHGSVSCLEKCASDGIWRLVVNLKNRSVL